MLSVRSLHKVSSSSHINSGLAQIRLKSTSPYGRSHLRRTPTLPNPVVPLFKQRVILSDGSTFTHFTTSPRSVIRLTRDLTNNPFWSPAVDPTGGTEEESGRMGRFNKRFGQDEGSRITFEYMEGPMSAQNESNALAMAAKLGLGGKYKAPKNEAEAKKEKGKKK
ncbi:hypothetical protein FRB99_008376 [Tulasnella sp. 403]|nr:hypothetical protein FRB99_008376 [Tulasnella sp. 403]